MIKIPFDRQYALSMKNEKKLPLFFRNYDNNDYENSVVPSQPHLFKYSLKPPTLEMISAAYNFKNETNLDCNSNRASGAHLFLDTQLLFINSFQKSQTQSETKEYSENLMFLLSVY